MNPWLILFPVVAVMCAGSWLSYREDFKPQWWFPWSLAGLAAGNGLLWSWAARLTDARTLYSMSICWDCITILAYSALPLVAFGVKLTPLAGVGVLLVVAGACLVKWG